MPITTNIEPVKFASTHWQIEDLQDVGIRRGITISDEDADRLLAEHSSMIVNAMTEAGWIALDCIIDEYDN